MLNNYSGVLIPSNAPIRVGCSSPVSCLSWTNECNKLLQEFRRRKDLRGILKESFPAQGVRYGPRSQAHSHAELRLCMPLPTCVLTCLFLPGDASVQAPRSRGTATADT